eukprot:10423811-Ditylum_brightwellii.AAC.1
MHGQNPTHDTDDCFKLNRRNKHAKSGMSQSGKDKVSYRDLNTFVYAKVKAALNKVKKKQKERKEKEVKINAFNKLCSLNVESSDKEGELKASTTAVDSN